MALIVALYGLTSNSDWRNLECTMLLTAGAVLTFGLRWNGPLLRRVYIAIVFASIAGDLYYGAARARVFRIGPHMFFEWQENQHRIESGFLKNMRVSSTMIEVERELKLATTENPGPDFFGPRLDFNYAALGLPSPEYFPAGWEPRTAFAVSDQAHLIQGWQEHKFQTLIFLNSVYAYGTNAYKDGLQYDPKEFIEVIRGEDGQERQQLSVHCLPSPRGVGSTVTNETYCPHLGSSESTTLDKLLLHKFSSPVDESQEESMMAFPTETTSSSISLQQNSFRLALRLAMVFAVVKLAIHIATNIYTPHIGYRMLPDEYYYILCGRHLAWGYVDHGPMVTLRTGADGGVDLRVMGAWDSASSRPWPERCGWD